jgi:transcription elongation factor Elf1
MSKEAMKLALEAMERYQVKRQDFDRFADEIIALQKALANEALDRMAENERELGIQMQPTEWLTGCPSCGMDSCDCDEGTYNPLAQTSTYTCGVCGVSMQMERPAQQEPVAWYRDEDGIRIYYESKVWDDATPLYTSPPAQRPWVGLTHEDIVIILNNDYGGSRADCIRAAEARLKERNT